MTIAVKINDIKAGQLPKVGWPKRPGRFYVKLLVDGEVRKTAESARGDVASWTETLNFNTLGSSVLKIQVYAKHSLSRDVFVGGTEDTVDSLIAKGATTAITSELFKFLGIFSALLPLTLLTWTLNGSNPCMTLSKRVVPSEPRRHPGISLKCLFWNQQRL